MIDAAPTPARHALKLRRCFAGALLAVLTAGALAQRPVEVLPQPAGFLCCNMHTDGKWISDINYVENAPAIVPLGTPAQVTGYGRHRVQVQLGGKPQTLGNDYSRTLKPEDFARRYVVPEDPLIKLASMPAEMRNAILAGHIRRGMSREQVAMAVGYPITSENPRLDAATWRYWRSMSDEFQVLWTAQGPVADVIGEVLAKRAVFEE